MDARSNSPALSPHSRLHFNSGFSDEEALAAIKQINRHYFKITGLPAGEPLYFFALGCQGEESDNQKAVAKRMHEHAEKKRPAIILFLGDNFYGYTAQSPSDERFKTRYDDVYDGLGPWIAIPGNHCEGFDKSSYVKNFAAGMFYFVPIANRYITPSKTDTDAINQQIAHTFKQKHPDFYSNPELAISEMPNWNMLPFATYDFENKNTQLFCLNSNHYVSHFINYLKPKDDNSNEAADEPMTPIEKETNQALLLDHYFFEAEKKGRTTIIAAHNPRRTASKRDLPHKYDANQYLSPEEIQQMNYLLSLGPDLPSLDTVRQAFSPHPDPALKAKIAAMPFNGNYAAMFDLCFRIQGIRPDAHLCAHDHTLSYTRDDQLCQMISGAGGSSDLMPKMSKRHDGIEGCYINEPGFTAITAYPDHTIRFDVYSTDVQLTKEQHLAFTNHSHLPIERTDSSATPENAFDLTARPGMGIVA